MISTVLIGSGLRSYSKEIHNVFKKHINFLVR